MPRGSRLALLGLALLLSASLLVKGRVPAGKGEDAAFFSSGGPRFVTVRLAGELPRPGLYRFPVGTLPWSAIKMTLPGSALPAPLPAGAERPLVSGDVVTLRISGGQPAVLAMGSMRTRERMLLGIVLDPDRLGPEDWALLPGIGPVLAARIAADRQKNGAFGSLAGVLRVPGIGPGKLEGIRRYF